MIFYGFARLVTGIYLRLALGYRQSGRDLVPADEPLIVCANHSHWLDPFVIVNASPRPIHFMAKQELFTNPVMAGVYRSLGAFPVRRGEVDRAALRTCLDLLKDGRAVGIFPEGTRSRTGTLRAGEPGAAVISLMTGARVITAGIAGFMPGERLRIAWGTPIDPRQYGSATSRRDRAVVAAFTREIMASIANLSGRPMADGSEQ